MQPAPGRVRATCNPPSAWRPQARGFPGASLARRSLLPGGMTSIFERLRPRPGRYDDLIWRILAGLLVVALAGVLLWSMGAERRAIRDMDPRERRAVYEQAVGELDRLCGAGPRDDALEQRCRDQIRFVVQFPECDAHCQEIARSHAPRPTK